MKKLIFLVFVLALSASCVKQDEVTIIGISNPSLNLPSAMNFCVNVENRSGHKLQLIDCKIDAVFRGQKMLGVVLADKVVVPRHFTGSVPVDLRLRMTNPMVAMMVFGDMQRYGNDLEISGEMVVKAGWGRKKIKLDKQNVLKYLATFGVSY